MGKQHQRQWNVLGSGIVASCLTTNSRGWSFHLVFETWYCWVFLICSWFVFSVSYLTNKLFCLFFVLALRMCLFLLCDSYLLWFCNYYLFVLSVVYKQVWLDKDNLYYIVCYNDYINCTLCGQRRLGIKIMMNKLT